MMLILIIFHHFELNINYIIKTNKGDVLEIGAQCSVAVGDIPAFERYISQLKAFYFDFQ